MTIDSAAIDKSPCFGTGTVATGEGEPADADEESSSILKLNAND